VEFFKDVYIFKTVQGKVIQILQYFREELIVKTFKKLPCSERLKTDLVHYTSKFHVHSNFMWSFVENCIQEGLNPGDIFVSLWDENLTERNVVTHLFRNLVVPVVKEA
jgi:hypothetical protein